MLVPRGKAVGGTSAINGQVVLRGTPEDYDEWAALGNTEWAYTRVLPYFRKMETDLDNGGSEVHGGTAAARTAAQARRLAAYPGGVLSSLPGGGFPA